MWKFDRLPGGCGGPGVGGSEVRRVTWNVRAQKKKQEALWGKRRHSGMAGTPAPAGVKWDD